MSRSIQLGMAAAAAVLVCGPPSLAADAAKPVSACDRACLIKITDKYLAAIVAHDPGKAPLAANLVFVENVTRMKPGEGVWKTATGGPTAFKIYVPDVALQQVGWLGVIEQDHKPMMLALRLKIENGKIVQAEHLLAAPFNGAKNPYIAKVRPGLVSEVPADKRRRTTSCWPSARPVRCARRQQGFRGALRDGLPAARERHHHRGRGGWGAADQGRQYLADRARLQGPDRQRLVHLHRSHRQPPDDRRRPGDGPRHGPVRSLPFTNLPYRVKHIDGSTSERNAQNMKYKPFDMPAAHIFKVGPEGQIHEIEAIGFTAPYKSATGWEGAR